MYDCIIIGCGTAGMTAALYLRRASKKVLILEAKNYGGQIINASSIENYPCEIHISGYEFATKLFNQVKELNAEIVFEKAIDIKDNNNEKEVITNNNIFKTKTIILATGSDNRKLGLPNENELIGKGVSYCATCDGNFYKNKAVAVIGGGINAIEEALYLSDIASKVYLINRKNEFKEGNEILSKIKEKNNIEIIYNSSVTKLNAQDKLNSIEITSNSNSKGINVDGIFIAVGRVPENENFAKIINLNENGYVIADENCNTNVSGIFVAGDNRVKQVRQLVTAASDGAVAATEAIKYLNKNL